MDEYSMSKLSVQYKCPSKPTSKLHVDFSSSLVQERIPLKTLMSTQVCILSHS